MLHIEILNTSTVHARSIDTFTIYNTHTLILYIVVYYKILNKYTNIRPIHRIWHLVGYLLVYARIWAMCDEQEWAQKRMFMKWMKSIKYLTHSRKKDIVNWNMIETADMTTCFNAYIFFFLHSLVLFC